MSKEFFEQFPTYLGLAGTKELRGAPKPNQIAYVEHYYNLAVKAGKKFGLNPLVILAQGAIESGWGSTDLALLHHNFFGITAKGPKNAYWKGASYTSKTSKIVFRSYPSIEDGFSDFARLITEQYKEAAIAGKNVEDYAAKIAYSPYISEKNGDNRERYRELIIACGNTIKAIVGKKLGGTPDFF